MARKVRAARISAWERHVFTHPVTLPTGRVIVHRWTPEGVRRLHWLHDDTPVRASEISQVEWLAYSAEIDARKATAPAP